MPEQRRQMDGDMDKGSDRDLAGSADRLSAFWNEVVLAGPAAPEVARGLDPDPALAALTDTVRQIAARDDAPPPPPGLADATWQNLMRRHGAAAAALASPTGAASPNGRHNAPPVPNRHPHPQHRPASPRLLSRPRWAMASTATAALLVLSLIGAYVVFISRDEQPAVIPAVEAPSSPLDVPMDRGDPARSGAMPGPGPAGPPTLRWRFDVGAGVVRSPVVVDGVVYVGRGHDLCCPTVNDQPGALFALDAVTGGPRWEFATLGQVQGSPAVGDGLVYVADTAGILYAVETASGAERWRLPLGGFPASLTIASGVVYVASATDFQDAGLRGVAPGSSNLRGASAAAVAADTVFIGAGATTAGPNQTALWAVDAATGAVRWRKDDFPAASALYALDATSGAVRWQVPTGALAVSPTVGGSTVYLGAGIDGAVLAFDTATGQERWRSPIRQLFGEGSSLAVADGRVFVTVRGGDHIALDAATGEERWRVPGQTLWWISSPVVAGDTVYVLNASGVYALAAADGAERWNHPFGGDEEAFSPPVVTDGVVYLGIVGRTYPYPGSLVALADPTGGVAAATPAP